MRQVLHQHVDQPDRFIPRAHADVDVQPERDALRHHPRQSPLDADHALIVREGMNARAREGVRPPQRQVVAERAGDVVKLAQARAKLLFGLHRGGADIRLHLNHRLHQLRRDPLHALLLARGQQARRAGHEVPRVAVEDRQLQLDPHRGLARALEPQIRRQIDRAVHRCHPRSPRQC